MDGDASEAVHTGRGQHDADDLHHLADLALEPDASSLNGEWMEQDTIEPTEDSTPAATNFRAPSTAELQRRQTGSVTFCLINMVLKYHYFRYYCY